MINFVPDGTQLIILSLTLYIMTKELIENTQKVAELITETTASAISVVGASVGLGAGVVTAWSIGDIVAVVVKAALALAYAIAIVLAIVNLIEEIFAQLLPKKRFHLGMTFRQMFVKACQYLNLSFSSSIAELDWVHIPAKDRKGGEAGETGVPENSGNIYTFGDLIRVLSQMFNAQYRIQNGVFLFERRDKFKTVGDYVIPAFFWINSACSMSTVLTRTR